MAISDLPVLDEDGISLPSLQNLYLNTAELTPCAPLESLKQLDVEASPITEVDVKSVARYLAHLFPRLKMLETLVDSLEGETDREEELIPELWSTTLVGSGWRVF
ncbi:hypothetical protein FB45DRAFT_1036809 [Roridomyces roridus]|uniref:Uncharacterized protein n=1 Tax=Roridomyces roridus TaxID=1738132 RepID=A0AAD7B767_9AGAR|nr:hypothetical protein FB45DRAFT_1036809 [Roridomyces roridus]